MDSRQVSGVHFSGVRSSDRSLEPQPGHIKHVHQGTLPMSGQIKTRTHRIAYKVDISHSYDIAESLHSLVTTSLTGKGRLIRAEMYDGINQWFQTFLPDVPSPPCEINSHRHYHSSRFNYCQFTTHLYFTVILTANKVCWVSEPEEACRQNVLFAPNPIPEVISEQHLITNNGCAWGILLTIDTHREHLYKYLN